MKTSKRNKGLMNKSGGMFPMLPMEKCVKPHIKSNSDGGFPVGCNLVEVGRN